MTDTPYRIFEIFLREKSLRLTSQRRKILDIFLKVEKHLSVEDLYDIVKKKNLNIGSTTVFRTLKLLTEAKIARQVDFDDKKVRYEHGYGHKHHDHLICTRCGKSLEVLDDRIERLQEKLCKKYKFTLEHHRLEIFGICKRCKKGTNR